MALNTCYANACIIFKAIESNRKERTNKPVGNKPFNLKTYKKNVNCIEYRCINTGMCIFPFHQKNELLVGLGKNIMIY